MSLVIQQPPTFIVNILRTHFISSIFTGVIVLCPWARNIYPCLVTGSTQEDPPRHNWKIAD